MYFDEQFSVNKPMGILGPPYWTSEEGAILLARPLASHAANQQHNIKIKIPEKAAATAAAAAPVSAGRLLQPAGCTRDKRHVRPRGRGGLRRLGG